MAGIPVLDKSINRLMELDQASVFAIADIAEERVRQVEKEGWTTEHDDQHTQGEMTAAAACYAACGSLTPSDIEGSIRGSHPLGRSNPEVAVFIKNFWPATWDWKWWKPKSPHRNKVRAGALLVADLARHFRSAP